MYKILVVLALAATAIAAQCVESPLDGHAVGAEGYPQMTVVLVGKNLVFNVTMQQINATRPEAVPRAPTLGFSSRNSTASPVTLSWPAMSALDACTLGATSAWNISHLIAGGGWYKTVEGNYNAYHFTVAVTWADAVYFYDESVGLNKTSDPIRNRTLTTHLRFDLFITRVITVSTNVTYLSPITLFALAKRLEVTYDPELSMTVVFEVRSQMNFALTDAEVSNAGGAVTGFLGNVSIAAAGLKDGWNVFEVTFALAISPDACSFSALTPGAFKLGMNLTDTSDPLMWYPAALSVSLTSSEDWCPKNVTGAVTWNGQQSTYSSSSLSVSETQFYIADDVYFGAKFSVSPSASVTPSVAGASAVAASSVDPTNTLAVEIVSDTCPTGSDFTFCFHVPLSSSVFSSLYSYTITVTYELEAKTSRRDERAASKDRLSLATSVFPRLRTEKIEGWSPAYLLGIVGGMGGLAFISVFVAIASTGLYAFRQRRTGRHTRLSELSDL